MSFFINPSAHFMQQGAVAFIPGWIWLQMLIFVIAVFLPYFFQYNAKKAAISPYLFAFFIGSLMPVFDDLLAFVFGPPFAHHSLFHSLLGSVITYLIFRLLFNKEVAKYAFFGNILHILFNFYLDYVTFLFPLTYQEFGLTDITHISTYWLKVIHYPILLLLFAVAVYKYLRQFKNPD